MSTRTPKEFTPLAKLGKAKKKANDVRLYLIQLADAEKQDPNLRVALNLLANTLHEADGLMGSAIGEIETGPSKE